MIMDELISRQAVIDAVDEIETEIADGKGFQYEKWRKYFCDLPSAQPEQCEFCKNRGLEDGDTLYISVDWDGGIGFDFISDIHYCPKCGRRL